MAQDCTSTVRRLIQIATPYGMYQVNVLLDLQVFSKAFFGGGICANDANNEEAQSSSMTLFVQLHSRTPGGLASSNM